MGVLVFRHVPFEGLGLIGPVLEACGIAYEYADLFRAPDAEPALDSAAGYVFMGGPMSANDDLPYLRREINLIQDAAAAGKPVLGICLGAQLIAKAFGARIYPNPVKEIGWAPVYWTDAAQSDPLFHGLSEPETVFHWHGETFDLPAGAAWLAWSDGCRHQAFRAGAGIYGLQFHLEVTPAMIAGWLTEEENAGDVSELTAPVDPHANAVRLAELSTSVFERWAGLLTR